MLFDDGFFVSLMYVFQILNKDTTKEILNSVILFIPMHLKEPTHGILSYFSHLLNYLGMSWRKPQNNSLLR